VSSVLASRRTSRLVRSDRLDVAAGTRPPRIPIAHGADLNLRKSWVSTLTAVGRQPNGPVSPLCNHCFWSYDGDRHNGPRKTSPWCISRASRSLSQIDRTIHTKPVEQQKSERLAASFRPPHAAERPRRAQHREALCGHFSDTKHGRGVRLYLGCTV